MKIYYNGFIYLFIYLFIHFFIYFACVRFIKENSLIADTTSA